VDEPRDTNTGLVGAIVISRTGQAKDDGSPKDVDREEFCLFAIFDENLNLFMPEMRKHLRHESHEEDEEFHEANLKHSINGYIMGNMPMPVVKMGERVRWYMLALGTETDLHTPHWHGNTMVVGGHRKDVVELLPATTLVADMVPDNPGIWMFHCHVNDHIAAGMTARYQVLPKA
jgi:FtsP/CotA-like multicopper oxidase with cupredoxin domain